MSKQNGKKVSNFKLKNPDCVLIHIPKTGGTSIRKGVWKGNYAQPVFGNIPNEWNALFKFAFVRHPFDRFISAWKMFTIGAKGDKSWEMPADAYPVSIEDFFAISANEKIIYDERRRTFEEKIRHHTIPQTHPFNCLHLADYVGRFERLEKDFAVIANKLNIDADLPRMHHTQHGHWSKEIPETLVGKLYNYYQKDFGMLGYEPKI